MDIFISWSGNQSKFVAESLREWLPDVIQTLDPWMSSSDISKGAIWQTEIANRLEKTDFGIICLTPENHNKPWILFEAGALSKNLNSSYVCSILIELKPSDIKGPLTQFQLTQLIQEDIFNLLVSINKRIKEKPLTQEKLKEAFQTWWPKLEKKLSAMPKNTTEPQDERDDRDVLEEVLDITRNLSRSLYINEAENLYMQIRHFLATILPREEWVLRNFFDLWEGDRESLSLKEVAATFKTTQKEIKEIQNKGLQRLMNNIIAHLKYHGILK